VRIYDGISELSKLLVPKTIIGWQHWPKRLYDLDVSNWMLVDRNRKAMPVEIPSQVVSDEEREATEVWRFQSAWVSGECASFIFGVVFFLDCPILKVDAAPTPPPPSTKTRCKYLPVNKESNPWRFYYRCARRNSNLAVWGVNWFGVDPLFGFCDEGVELLVSVWEDLLFIQILDPHYCTMEWMKSSSTGV